jgi:REP element-mobilizing transposase RayT
MSKPIRKEHNASVPMHHIVCPAKCRKAAITGEADKKPREICLGIESRYETTFIEIGVEKDHAHFLARSAPAYSPEQMARTIKSISARKIFESCPEAKKTLWGGGFWTRGYYAGTVGGHGSEQAIREYVKKHGRNIESYAKLHEGQRLKLFSY